MALDYLFGGTPPPNVSTAAVSTNGLPDWYQEYLRGIAGKATDLAGNSQAAPVPAQSVAGFNQDQWQGLQQLRENQASWRPGINNATVAAQQITPAVNDLVMEARGSVAGPAQKFTDQYQQYMSPYTQGVVDNIARLGTRNFQENIMPGINSSMIGTGQFGSTRNADILSRAGRDVQADISGQQAGALEAGYGKAADIFGADANRAQQQQQLQGATSLAGAGAMTTGLQASADTQGALAKSYAQLGLGDAQALLAGGKEQQQLQQQGLDVAYTNAQGLNQQPWTNLQNLNTAVRGLPMPATTTSNNSGPLPGAPYTQGPVGALGQAYGATSSLR